jgi:hypothetical protein
MLAITDQLWYATPEWWLAILGFPTLFFLAWQAVETRRAAEFANRNIESFMDKERARVEIIAGDIALGSQQPTRVGVTLKNGGPTMAFIEEGAVRLVKTQKEVEPNYIDCAKVGFVGTLPANSTSPGVYVVFLKPEPTLTEAQILEIREGKSFIHFYGFVRYRDVYERTHRVRVHLRWVMLWGLVMEGQVTEWWEPAGIREENSDTEEKSAEKNWMQRVVDRLDKLSDGPS